MIPKDYLARNIRALREAQGVTQEQLATALNISFQAVSKWENAVTVPDTMMLPALAQYFGTSIDDLFRQDMKAYANNAIRLLSVFEQSHNQDDFIRADAEFKKLFDGGSYTLDDVRAYGVLYEYHMYYCRDKALEQYDKVIAQKAGDNACYSARQQRILLLSRIGRSQESIEREQESLREDPADVNNHVALMVAYHFAGEYAKAIEVFEQAMLRFPEGHAALYTCAGDAFRALHRYDEAFDCWNKALSVNEDFVDPLFSTAFCCDELGRYDEEIAAWQRIIDWLMKKGMIHEQAMPQKMLKAARDKQLAGHR
ncbi:MAG: helix-turn-helix domain-containing protein [Christensenellaceae bacterium]|nr:helix-turn-helix domain-containing protein [Christensenellaceae bacterium]